MPAYDNSAIAAKLGLYADVLEISGAEKYRFLSYRKAANAIRSWPDQAADLAREGRLTEIAGVGPKMAVAVAEIVERGSFADLDSISEKYPAGLAEVMRVPGVGPKRALSLFQRLDVSSLEALRDALERGDVERLGGFGTKTAEKISSSLHAHLLRCARTPLATALPTALAALDAVRSLQGVDRAELAGSVRRRKETVGNIDLVAASASAFEARQEIVGLPLVESVISDESDEIRVELHDGLELSVRVVEPERFGSEWIHWTGSAAFTGALAVVARDRGLPLDEQGRLLSRPTREESEAFEMLGLPEIAPELREEPGIVSTALERGLPKLVELADVRGDLQTHSTFTDGKTSLEANRSVAAELGYQYFAATDHAYALRMVGGLDLADLERQWQEIDELNGNRGDAPLILKGIELNISEDGALDYDDEVLAMFDVALASLHSGWDQDSATVTRRLLRAIEHPLVDIIAHPTGRILGRRDPMPLDMDEVLAAAGETGTIMEINSYPDRLDLSDAHIRVARGHGVRFSLGTDAHAAEQMRHMHYGVAQARRGVVQPHELLNAQPWEIAATWLKRSRVR